MHGTNMKNVEFYSKNKFEKLVHLVGFIIRGSMTGLVCFKLLCGFCWWCCETLISRWLKHDI